MKIVSQTLSLLGMMAIAVLIVVIYRGVVSETAGFPALRALGVLVFAAACFWGAARVKVKE